MATAIVTAKCAEPYQMSQNWKKGRVSDPRPWLGDFTWALPAIGAIGTWITYGLCMVLFVSGVQKIPSSLYDAARASGNIRRKFCE